MIRLIREQGRFDPDREDIKRFGIEGLKRRAITHERRKRSNAEITQCLRNRDMQERDPDVASRWKRCAGLKEPQDTKPPDVQEPLPDMQLREQAETATLQRLGIDPITARRAVEKGVAKDVGAQQAVRRIAGIWEEQGEAGCNQIAGVTQTATAFLGGHLPDDAPEIDKARQAIEACNA